MRIVRLVIGAILCSLAPVAVAAQPDDAVVYAASARVEIERILASDNLDTDTLSSRVVADAIAGIARGRAPDDFWRAYQAHVTAWHHLADAEERLKLVADDPTSLNHRAAELGTAARRIETTFDEVERIARLYGARLPIPVTILKSIV